MTTKTATLSRARWRRPHRARRGAARVQCDDGEAANDVYWDYGFGYSYTRCYIKLLSGMSDCAVAGARHSGHSGFFEVHDAMHRQQKTCPHAVAVGILRRDRHNAHFTERSGDVGVVDTADVDSVSTFPNTSRVAGASSTATATVGTMSRASVPSASSTRGAASEGRVDDDDDDEP